VRTWFLLASLISLEPVLGQTGMGGQMQGQPVPVRIDPGHGDTSINAISLRKLDLDLRQPAGFQHVYQISTIDAFGAKQSTFMRIDGAVAAVFPRSVYLPAAGVLMPDIPPGTVFHIGGVPNTTPPDRRQASTFLDLSAAAGPDPVDAPPVVSMGSMFTDERYRQRRLDALMTYALER
jgi:hypothetical protein